MSAENNFAKWLAHLQDDAKARSLAVYLIVDQSAFPRMAEARSRLQGMTQRNILRDTNDADIDGASPLLLCDDGAEYARLPGLARWLYVQGRYANGVMVLVSGLSTSELHTQLRLRTELMLPDRLRMVLRYFDTRALTLLPRLLSPQQYAAFTACATEWHYLSRAGELLQLPAAPLVQDSAYASPLQLNAEQEQILIDDALTDSVIDQLLDLNASTLHGLTPPQQYERIAPLVADARKWGLNDTLEALAYVDIALLQGAGFAGQEPWASRLAAHRKGELPLAQVFQDDAA